MNRRRVALLGVLVVVAVVGVFVLRGSSSDDRERNATVSLIGATCKKPGAIKKSGGVSYVCGKIRKAKKNQGIYYGVAVVKKWRCENLGTTRFQNGIFSVCSGGKDRKKRKWALTVPMPVSVQAVLDREESTVAGALEASGIPIPPEIVKLPGMIGPVAGPTTTSAPTATTTVAAQSTTPAPVGSTATTLPATTVPPTTSAPSTSTAPSMTTAPPTPTTIVARTVACAEGGPCGNGDRGPAGGVVLVIQDEEGTGTGVFEVAPATWYIKQRDAKTYVERFVFGSQSDWRLPTNREIVAMHANRSLFVCPTAKRCAQGFANDFYFFEFPNPGPENVRSFDFAKESVRYDAQSFAYLRPVRSISGAAG